MPPQAQHYERNSREHSNTGNDHASTSGETNSVATPSSVYMPASIALSRDNMSDLSGISGDRSSSNQVPGQILDPKSLLKPWSQAYSLSPKPPDKSHLSQSAQSNKNPLIWVAENDVVEIFDDLESSLGLDRFQIRKHDRIPIMVLLMDPCKQTYELMQIWVDRANDSIRDLVQVLQHKLPNQWKQAYDGLFQVRGNRFTQLINIIKLVKYDMQPNEILIAKPWSMAAKVAITVAGSAIRHLTRIGVIESDLQNKQNRKHPQPRNEDAPLLLSRLAQDRAYFPMGILDHHHATQFITFSPPFEFNCHDLDDILGAREHTREHAREHASQQASNSEFPPLDNADSESENKNVRTTRTIKTAKTEKSPGILTRVLGKPRSNKSDNQQFATSSYDESTTTKSKEQQEQQLLQVDTYSSRSATNTAIATRGRLGCLSKLNCLRNSKTRDSDEHNPHISMATLTEEEEKRWLAYSMKPIDEDQSLANGSVVSMSAPLLR